jgi:cytosine permease
VSVYFFMRSSNIFGTILVAVHYLGIFLVAWVGVAVAHVLFCSTPSDSESQRDFKWNGLLAWIVGVAVGIGLGLLDGASSTFAAPATLLASAVMYIGIQRLAGSAVPQRSVRPTVL